MRKLFNALRGGLLLLSLTAAAPAMAQTDSTLVDESLKTEVEQALKTLSDRERNIVKAFFGIGQPELTLDEIGMKFGLTRERVRQIKEKALRNLRNNNKYNILKGYLGK